ncbi:hypothetical protein JCM19235_1293 [Vibrio maritimus]|uniref:Uncharacterized protein n=1 Tax=Vibrio maritimus TaxID=990268 RepID=A0A090SUL1_9VIBR|nr:hypothetical protein JCM19235_1293 [Vibrio maritimus]
MIENYHFLADKKIRYRNLYTNPMEIHGTEEVVARFGGRAASFAAFIKAIRLMSQEPEETLIDLRSDFDWLIENDEFSFMMDQEAVFQLLSQVREVATISGEAMGRTEWSYTKDSDLLSPLQEVKAPGHFHQVHLM